MTNSMVYITTSFEAQHRWKDAPTEVGFLRSWHRHIFHVKAYMQVSHDNRDVEFIMLKRRVRVYIDAKYTGQQFEMSCEMLAKDILEQFNFDIVEVSEDGENGGVVSI